MQRTCVCVCTDEGVGYQQGSNVNVLSFKKNAIVDTSSSGADIGDNLLFFFFPPSCLLSTKMHFSGFGIGDM